MARSAEGWTVRWRDGLAHVRFRWQGRRYSFSTGTRDPHTAATKAAQIYSEVIGRRKLRPAALASLADLGPLTAEWIADLEATHDPRTAKEYDLVASRWPWPTLGDVTTKAVADWQRDRLREVTRETTRKHCVALRSFFLWAKEQGHLDEIPEIPTLPRRSVGVRAREEKARDPLSPAQVQALLKALPVWTTTSKRHPRGQLRDWAIVAWETGLRPSTLAKLRTPTHYRKGRATLTITADIDKARFARELPLSKDAADALTRSLPKEEGLIFGSHDYRAPLELVSKKILKRTVRPYDFRHSRITAWVREGKDLLGVQFLAGHKDLSTTAKYAHARAEAALGIVRPTG